jgi:hypothetical protein
MEGPMQNEFRLPESTEPMTELEVRALVERFGERQAMGVGQPTVHDVAEALQVDSATVSQMLQELRRSKDEEDIRARLDRMEKENAELRMRALNPTGYYQPVTTERSMRPQILAVFMALFVAMGTATMASGTRFGFTFSPLPLLTLFLLFGLIFFAVRRNRDRK